MDIINRVRVFMESTGNDAEVDGDAVRSILDSVVAAYDKPHNFGRAIAAMQQGSIMQSDDDKYTLRIRNDLMERRRMSGAWTHICKIPTDVMLFCNWRVLPSPESA